MKVLVWGSGDLTKDFVVSRPSNGAVYILSAGLVKGILSSIWGGLNLDYNLI